MRARAVIAFLIVSAACDLQPPPKQRAQVKEEPVGSAGSAAPTPTPPVNAFQDPAAVDPNNTPPIAPPVDAGVARVDAVVTTAECNNVAVHIADTMIAAATDPALKAAITQDRARTIRRMSVACTQVNWAETTRACFLGAKTPDELAVCGKDLAAPTDDQPPNRPPPPAQPGGEGH